MLPEKEGQTYAKGMKTTSKYVAEEMGKTNFNLAKPSYSYMFLIVRYNELKSM